MKKTVLARNGKPVPLNESIKLEFDVPPGSERVMGSWIASRGGYRAVGMTVEDAIDLLLTYERRRAA